MLSGVVHLRTVQGRKQGQTEQKTEAMIAAKIVSKIIRDLERSGLNSEMFTTDVWDTFLHKISTGIVVENITKLRDTHTATVALHVFSIATIRRMVVAFKFGNSSPPLFLRTQANNLKSLSCNTA